MLIKLFVLCFSRHQSVPVFSAAILRIEMLIGCLHNDGHAVIVKEASFFSVFYLEILIKINILYNIQHILYSRFESNHFFNFHNSYVGLLRTLNVEEMSKFIKMVDFRFVN